MDPLLKICVYLRLFVSNRYGILRVPHYVVQAVLVCGNFTFIINAFMMRLFNRFLAGSFYTLLALCWRLARLWRLAFARNGREKLILIIIDYGWLVTYTTTGSEPGHTFGWTVCIRCAFIQCIAIPIEYYCYLCTICLFFCALPM